MWPKNLQRVGYRLRYTSKCVGSYMHIAYFQRRNLHLQCTRKCCKDVYWSSKMMFIWIYKIRKSKISLAKWTCILTYLHCVRPLQTFIYILYNILNIFFNSSLVSVRHGLDCFTRLRLTHDKRNGFPPKKMYRMWLKKRCSCVYLLCLGIYIHFEKKKYVTRNDDAPYLLFFTEGNMNDCIFRNWQ